MPQVGNLHVDALLTNVSVRYSNTNYIADKVFPMVPVKKNSDLYRVYLRDFRIPETARAMGGEANEHQFEVTTSSYNLVRHSLREFVADEQETNYDLSSLRVDTTESLTDTILRRVEKTVADLFTVTNWSLNVSLGATDAKWSVNTVLSNPIVIFDTAATTIIANSGIEPNFGIIPRTDLINIKNHTSVLDRIKFTQLEITKNMLAGLLGIKELLVPTAINNTAAESQGNATLTIADLWADNNFVGWKPSSAGPKKPSSGYIFQFAKSMTKRYRQESREGEWIEVDRRFDAKIVASLTGFLIRDVR